ncbi:MAG: phosphatase PAP2 family protein [Bacteroidota bacterium]|nr:phosphatase PAP2 family protein [Bacteroidota bacterium]
MVIAVVLFLLTLFVFVTITDEIVLEHENGFDSSIANAILSFESPLATKIFETITFFGSSSFLFPAYSILIVYYLFKRNWKLALDVAAIGITSTALLYLLKNIFQRHRPLDPLIRNVTGFSFPSGHSFSSFTFFGMIAYLIWQTQIKSGWKIFATVILFSLATAIAFSRVYLRVHYPSDVVAGFCLSMIWLMISIWALHNFDKKVHNPAG